MGIDEIINGNRDEVLRLASLHGASNVRVFGSVARGEAGPDSDVDFLVEFEAGRSLMDLGRLLLDLEELLGRRADILTERSIHWFIRDRVMNDAVAL